MSQKELLQSLFEIKKQNDLTIFDTHVHPHEVLGVPHSDRGKSIKRSLLEYLEFHPFAVSILHILFKYFPDYITNQITERLPYLDENILSVELKKSHIDNVVLVPVGNHGMNSELYKKAPSTYLRLGTIDVHNLDIKQIKDSIDHQISNYHILGIKLHPNIQSFFPEPSLNSIDLSEKLRFLYGYINIKKLYILIHGGISYVPDAQNRYRYLDYGLLKNYFDKSGRTFLLDLKVPVVIAHLGIYNVKHPSFSAIKNIVDIPNVYFDSAGVATKYIRRFLSEFGHSKLIFGSDAPYFNIEYNVYLTLKAIKKAIPLNYENAVKGVFSVNFSGILRMIS